MLKKISIIFIIVLLSTVGFAYEISKDSEYYKSQIQNQRFLYNEAGLFNAITENNSIVVEYFMKAGFNPNSTFAGTPVVIHALYVNDNESFNILLKYGANTETKVPAFWVSIKPQNLLSFAIKRQSSDAVKTLIVNNVNVNKKFNGRTPLNYAIQTKQSKIVELLLNAGATPDYKTYKLIKKTKDEYIKDLFIDYEW